MPEARAATLLPIPREEVWDFAADVRNAPRWVVGVREVAGDLRHPLQPGDRLRVRLLAGGRVADSEWEIGECARPERLRSRGRALGATAVLTIECREAGAGQTEVGYRLSYQLPGGPLGQLASRLGVQQVLELQARQSVAGLRRLLLGGAPDPAWRRALHPGEP